MNFVNQAGVTGFQAYGFMLLASFDMLANVEAGGMFFLLVW